MIADMLVMSPGATGGLLGFSLAVNLLLLVSPLYMLQVYDRVLTSGSRDALIWLSLIAVFLLLIYAAAEAGRRRLSTLMAGRVESRFASRMFARFAAGDDREPRLPQDAANLSRIQGALQNGTLIPFLDLPFTPLFFFLLFLLHPVLGLVGLAGAFMIGVVALAAEWATRRPGKRAAQTGAQAQMFLAGLSAQRSAIVAMGIGADAQSRWLAQRNEALAAGTETTTRDGTFSALARSVRQVLQVAALGAGAALALAQEISPGTIVAASIIMTRALGPVDQIVGSWRTLVQAQEAWNELRNRLGRSYDAKPFTALPAPPAHLMLDRLSVSVPGSDAPLVRPFSYEIGGGHGVALVGNNGAGKTTLLQILAGVWAPPAGHVMFGGRDMHRWPSDDRGQHVGYVPQAVELLPGTVAENIARFRKGPVEAVFEAARRSGAHETILALPDGYDTRLGPGGYKLSAGQRQLVGLARAFYGHPVLLLLDEPTANLDPGAALRTIAAIRAALDAGAIVVASTHDLRLVHTLDVALVIRRGGVMTIPAREYSGVEPGSDPIPVPVRKMEAGK
jgi:PrtD family type I secretion system ABC transporter